MRLVVLLVCLCAVALSVTAETRAHKLLRSTVAVKDKPMMRWARAGHDQRCFKLTVDYGRGVSRTAYVCVPTVKDAKRLGPNNIEMYPVVFSFHGFGYASCEELYDMASNALSDVEDAIVVLPCGSPLGIAKTSIRSWNAGQCCGSNRADVAFFADVLEHLISAHTTHPYVKGLYVPKTLETALDPDVLQANGVPVPVWNHPVDPLRVFVHGFSNGAMMAQRIVCELGSTAHIRAAVFDSASLNIKPLECPNYKGTTAILRIHSQHDTFVDYGGSYTTHATQSLKKFAALIFKAGPGAESDLAGWLARNHCTDAKFDSNAPTGTNKNIGADEWTYNFKTAKCSKPVEFVRTQVKSHGPTPLKQVIGFLRKYW